MISFNVPPYISECENSVIEAIHSKKISGDGNYTKKCTNWFNDYTSSNVLMTTSGSHSLDMTAILCDIKPGDEVIIPSFTFVTTANAFVLRGAKCVFVDIRPDTMNIDENLIENAITDKTKAIVAVHYAGVSCEMNKIIQIADKYNLKVIEDAAHGVYAKYNGQALGTFGDYGCYSFHETKNYSMGEGGAIIIKNSADFERAEIIREKGTNRNKFFRGQVDKYSWVDVGSSFLPSELNCAYLYPQLIKADEINNNRLRSWNMYFEMLTPLMDKGCIELPYIPDKCQHNAHLFYIKAKDLAERTKLINFLNNRDIQAVFHYIPLHSSLAGQRFGYFSGEDRYTTTESERLLRLPLYYDLAEQDLYKVVETIKEFYCR